jgi:cellulose synthase/poly-beta-1,6-N-acetylglucosamine synthase-like glycosyltransferase
MTEDIEFTVDCAVNDHCIGYCDKAMVYDEQPTTFFAVLHQRLRWSKGFYQVNLKYGVNLAKKALSCGGRRGHTCYDMFMTIAPCMLLSLLVIVFNAITGIAFLNATPYVAFLIKREVAHFILFTFLNLYLGVFLIGVLTVASEWNMIKETNFRKVKYLLVFPLFMTTYIPIAVIALFQKVEWKHIQHTSVSTLDNAVAAIGRKNM